MEKLPEQQKIDWGKELLTMVSDRIRSLHNFSQLA
jgi:hypothetical protein